MINKITTFGWVWAVCFLASWGLIALIKESDGWYLGLAAVGISLPVSVTITGILFIFRSSIAGTQYEKQLNEVKGLRIVTVSAIIAFFGGAEVGVFATGVGQIIVFLAIIGAVIGMTIHLFEMMEER